MIRERWRSGVCTTNEVKIEVLFHLSSEKKFCSLQLGKRRPEKAQ